MAVNSFVLSDQVYILGGLKLSGSTYFAYDDFRIYNAFNDSWDELIEFPGGNTYGGFSFVIDSVAYIGLGANEFGTYHNEVWSFDVSNGWTKLSNFPGTLRVFPFAFSIEGKGYIGTGFSTNYLKDMWEYDPETDEWTKKADFPGGGRLGVAGFGVGTKGFAGIGDDGNSFYTDFNVYDPTSNTWSSIASFPGDNMSFPSCTSVYDKGYLIGGEYAHLAYTNEMWSYSPIDDIWTAKPEFIGTPRRYVIFQFENGIFYYGMGQTGPNDSNVDDGFWELESGLVNGINPDLHSSMKVFPNPFSDGIDVVGLNLAGTQMQIFNTSGQLIYGGPSKQINTSEWPSQVYYVHFLIDNARFTQKLVKR